MLFYIPLILIGVLVVVGLIISRVKKKAPIWPTVINFLLIWPFTISICLKLPDKVQNEALYVGPFLVAIVIAVLLHRFFELAAKGRSTTKAMGH